MILIPFILKLMLALAVAVPFSFGEIASELESSRRRNHVTALQSPAEWTCIVPYYNEAATIERCLSSLAAQTIRPTVILVDNGSTDNGSAVARRCCIDRGLQFVSFTELMPGKVAALARGLTATTTALVATCDADTFYPPDYLSRAGMLLNRQGVVAAGAILITNPGAKFRSNWERSHWRAASLAAPWQCHSGGAGQVFRTGPLREVGGFDPEIWNFVLEDHEVMARLGMAGGIAYDGGFWCHPLIRDDRHGKVGWSLAERVCYHMTARRSMPAYFASYLAPRLAQRGQWNIKLRPIDSAGAPRARSFAPTILHSPPQSVPESHSWPEPAILMR